MTSQISNSASGMSAAYATLQDSADGLAASRSVMQSIRDELPGAYTSSASTTFGNALDNWLTGNQRIENDLRTIIDAMRTGSAVVQDTDDSASSAASAALSAQEVVLPGF
jgi:uncharacterized protein YukE